MPHTIKFGLLSLIVLSISTFVFAQEIKTTANINPVPVNKLTQDLIQTPADFSVKSVKYFNITFESVSALTLNFYDANKSLQSKVTFEENTLKKSVRYTISSLGSDNEWVEISRTSENNKDISNAISSSGRSMKIITVRGENKGECKVKIPLSGIEIFVDNSFVGKISQAHLQSKTAKGSLQSLTDQSENMFYDTIQLRNLRIAVASLNELLHIVAKQSKSNVNGNATAAPESVSTDCNVFCFRIGTVVPVYACNDDTFNCSRCGVDGFYYIGAACIFCAIPCYAFYS